MAQSSGVTSVAITREASKTLDDVAKMSGLPKSYLADVVIKLFYSSTNPNLSQALEALAQGRNLAEREFIDRLFNTKE
jgi:hypothetical protein